MKTKSAMITIAGRPNVGKSTLVNALTGEKVAIVTPKPQTTRNRIFGVITKGDTQIVLLDTPGFHKAKNRLGDYMMHVVRESVADVDAVALVVDPIPRIGTQEQMLIDHLKQNGVPGILVINKIDTVKKDELLRIIALYNEAHSFAAVVPISAKYGDGVEDIMGVLENYAAEGPHLFPDDMVTDQPEKQIVAEIVREKLLICLDREIPHGTAVEVTKFTERDESIIDLDVTIFCEKQRHKGMIIGKNGTMLKKIGQLARIDIERFMGTKVYLQTWVKVKENWRDSGTMIKNFGYMD